MLDFKAKILQIRFPLGLSPRSHWRSLERYQEPLADLRDLLLKNEKGKGGVGRGGMGEKGLMQCAK